MRIISAGRQKNMSYKSGIYPKTEDESFFGVYHVKFKLTKFKLTY